MVTGAELNTLLKTRTGGARLQPKLQKQIKIEIEKTKIHAFFLDLIAFKIRLI